MDRRSSNVNISFVRHVFDVENTAVFISYFVQPGLISAIAPWKQAHDQIGRLQEAFGQLPDESEGGKVSTFAHITDRIKRAAWKEAKDQPHNKGRDEKKDKSKDSHRLILPT